MYPVTELYKEKIKENNRLFEAEINIHHSGGTLTLTDKDLVLGSLSFADGSQVGEEFTIGGTVAADISFKILNKPEYENIDFMGARVTGTISLLLHEGADAHFLQASQPSKFQGFDELWEGVPIGKYNIDVANPLRNTIEIKAMDDMINLDKPYSLSKLSYPATLFQIYVNICNVADVTVGTNNFPNKDYIVTNRPDDNLTLRDVLGYVAELSGTFAKFNRTGGLELRWYTQTGLVLGPANRFDFKPSDDVVSIKGVMATVGDTTYLAGSEDYAIDLTDNPLLQTNHETVLLNIYNAVKNTVFTPYTSDWQGNPAIQAGDIIKQIDRDGKKYDTLVTKSTYKYRGRSQLEAKGLPDIAKGYKGSTDKRIAQIKRIVAKEVGDKLTTLEQAQLNAMELMGNMLGGHLIEDKINGIIYIADNPNIALATKLWKWGTGGFGYSEDGGVTWKTAITADGSIVAMLVAAGIITADMVQTGILQSEDGSVWINLDSNKFNLGNALIWDGLQLRLQSPDIPDVDLGDIESEIQDIKDLKPNKLKGGITTIDNTKVRVEHTGTNQYSEMRADGFVRKWQYGEARYLNDIYVGVFRSDGRDRDTPPPFTRINLPITFRGRQGKVEIFVAISQFDFSGGNILNGHVSRILRKFEIVNEVYDVNLSATIPYVDVDVYKNELIRYDDNDYADFYRTIDFMLIAIGY